MFKIIHIEWFKQLKRRENFMRLCMLFIPLLYGIGVSQHSTTITYHGISPISGLTFASNMYALVYMVFVIHLIIAINASNILKGEIDNGSLSMMLSRINDRGKLYRGKFYTQVIDWLAMTALFLVFSVFCYYAFIAKMDMASGLLIDQGWREDLYTLLGITSTYILAMSMVQCISLYVKSYVSIGVFILAWVLMLYVKAFPTIQWMSPLYYVSQLIDTGGAMDLIKCLILNGFLTALFVVIGNRRFNKSDLTR